MKILKFLVLVFLLWQFSSPVYAVTGSFRIYYARTPDGVWPSGSPSSDSGCLSMSAVVDISEELRVHGFKFVSAAYGSLSNHIRYCDYAYDMSFISSAEASEIKILTQTIRDLSMWSLDRGIKIELFVLFVVWVRKLFPR